MKIKNISHNIQAYVNTVKSMKTKFAYDFVFSLKISWSQKKEWHTIQGGYRNREGKFPDFSDFLYQIYIISITNT